MTKYNQLTQAEHMYIYNKKSLAEIGMVLGLSRRILFYWKKEYNWDKKRFDAEYNKDKFSEELIDFARKMMNKISTDIDNNQKTPPPEIYSLINILKNIPLVKQYTDSLQEQTQKNKTNRMLISGYRPSNRKRYFRNGIMYLQEKSDVINTTNILM